MELTDSLNEFERIAQVFDELNIDYQIGGSVASSIYGLPRGTQELDVEADIRQEHVEQLVGRLETEYLISLEAIKQALRYKSTFNLIPFNRFRLCLSRTLGAANWCG